MYSIKEYLLNVALPETVDLSDPNEVILLDVNSFTAAVLVFKEDEENLALLESINIRDDVAISWVINDEPGASDNCLLDVCVFDDSNCISEDVDIENIEVEETFAWFVVAKT